MSPMDSRATAGPTACLSEEQVYTAIADVLDPELDEPLVKLGFIDLVQVNGTDVTITFKLPTYWCSPNFAYLMASEPVASAGLVVREMTCTALISPFQVYPLMVAWQTSCK